MAAKNIQFSASAPAFIPSNGLNFAQTSRAGNGHLIENIPNNPVASNSPQRVSSNALLKAVRAAKARALGCSIVRQLGLKGKFPFLDPEWVNCRIDKV